MSLEKIKKLIHSKQKSKNQWPLWKLKRGAQKQYRIAHGKPCNLKNPKLFTEKLIWYKLFYLPDNIIQIVDKYYFKEYIRQRLGDGYTIPLYGAWTNLEDFRRDFTTLPQQFCLKSTLQSDGKCIKVIKNKNEVNLDALLEEVKEWLDPKKTLINSFCRAYHKGTPRFLAEEYVTQVDAHLDDYKFFCFSGVPQYIYVCTDRNPGEITKISFYDTEWHRLNVQYGKHGANNVPKPLHFEEMMEISRKLSAEFPFIRVDFFNTDEKLYVAELTFYPGGGMTPYYPESFDREMGDLFILPKETAVQK